ncbi:MAG: opacity family porin [Moraxella sp.]|nr:opacity family porin [Moraxella sp.]
MKKLVLASVLMGISSLAMANSGFYVQGDVGLSKLQLHEKDPDGDDKLKDSGTSLRVAVGKDMGNVRYALDYTNFGTLKYHETFAVDDYTAGKAKTQSFGVSAIYDFQSVSGFTPYAGARVGFNKVKLSVHAVDPLLGQDSWSDSDNAVGFGALAGVQYAISPQLALDAGAEYNHLGKFYPEKIKATQYGAKLGVRYNF